MADEMLGRLARYMRIAGLDVEYARGLSDDELLVRARAEGRTLVTRDVALANRSPNSVLLRTAALEAQWRDLRARFESWPSEVAFTRCTLCNGVLELEAGPPHPPSRAPHSNTPVYRCQRCGHEFWEGSHTSDLRRRIRRWSTGPPR